MSAFLVKVTATNKQFSSIVVLLDSTTCCVGSFIYFINNVNIYRNSVFICNYILF